MIGITRDKFLNVFNLFQLLNWHVIVRMVLRDAQTVRYNAAGHSYSCLTQNEQISQMKYKNTGIHKKRLEHTT